jgi:hypothetical protein
MTDQYFIISDINDCYLQAINKIQLNQEMAYRKQHTGCFINSFTTLKELNLYRGHTQRFDLS